MKRFFAPNLERNGRLLRGLSGSLLLIGGDHRVKVEPAGRDHSAVLGCVHPV
jgi:hypothetical protein